MTNWEGLSEGSAAQERFLHRSSTGLRGIPLLGKREDEVEIAELVPAVARSDGRLDLA